MQKDSLNISALYALCNATAHWHGAQSHNVHNFTLHKSWPSSSKFQPVFKVVDSKINLNAIVMQNKYI